MNKLVQIFLLLIPGISAAQTFSVGSINFYGNRVVSNSKLETVMPFEVGVAEIVKKLSAIKTKK